MANFQVFRETALPGTLQPYAMYLIAPASAPDFLEIYVTGSNSSIIKRVINTDDVQELIDASLSSLNQLEIVSDIVQRNALTPTANITVLVLDASDDPSVDSGAATYIYRLSTTEWIKISEWESLDLSFTWASLLDKPTSSVADIDDAVSKRHVHANKTELDKISEDANGNFIYNGALPAMAWESTGW
jgi:hypothetical protein